MSHDNVRIVQAVYGARGRGDLAALLPHLDPEFVAYESDALPYAGCPTGDPARWAGLNNPGPSAR
jgi:hypothetical protein